MAGGCCILEDVASEFNVGDEPVVSVGLPFGACLNLHVLDSWNELVDDEMLEADLSSELSDTIHEVFSLTMDDLSDVVELVLGHAEASLDTLRLILDFFELLLLRGEILSQLQLHSLLRLQILLHGELGTSTLLQLRLGLEELLLLLHSALHLFITA